MSTYRDPFSVRAEGIARRAIERADVHGMEHYGPAPAPLEETRDMIEEAIEELFDAIYYLTRQIAQLQDLRERGASIEWERAIMASIYEIANRKQRKV